MTESKKNQARSVFSTFADAYATSETHAKGNDLDQLIEWIKPNPSDIGLDIATGGGNVVKRLAPHLSYLYATDLTKDMLQNTSTYLTNLSNIHYVVADAESLPFLDESFDIVTCRIAAHHFPDPAQFIREVYRVLKPKGTFVLIDNVSPADSALASFMNTFEEMRDPSHVKALAVSEWKELFQQANLSIVNENTLKKRLPFKAWVNRTLTDQTQIDAVTSYLTSADQSAKQYFQFNEKTKTLESFTLDQWMAMAKKA